MRNPGHAIRTRVGRAIRRLRLLRNFSQEMLAEAAGTSAKHIGQIERGQVNVTLDILGRIARALAVEDADLFPRPRGRQRSTIPLESITPDEADQLIAMGERIKGLRGPRSKRTSR
jgi:transcriptional regulator with XRE-family HTH domain